MTFAETSVSGAFVIEPELRVDERGFFARVWCRDEFAARGLNSGFVQCNDSFSPRKGTLRGLHFQTPPHEEAKLIRCIGGAVFDVVVDLRPESPSYRRWMGVPLTAAGRTMVYVPGGCAHGYLTLEDQSEVMYAVTAPYTSASERGIRWNDPTFNIVWPVEPTTVSPKDQAWPDYAAV